MFAARKMDEDPEPHQPNGRWEERALLRLARALGVRELRFRLSRSDRYRLLCASVLPTLVVAGNLVTLAIEIAYGDPYGGRGLTAPEFWARVHQAAWPFTMASLVAVAGLFIAALPPVSRGIGSWGLLTAIGLTALAVVLLLGSSFALSVLTLTPEELVDYHVLEWPNWAFDAGALATGYAFLAYRGLSPTAYRTGLGPRKRRYRSVRK